MGIFYTSSRTPLVRSATVLILGLALQTGIVAVGFSQRAPRSAVETQSAIPLPTLGAAISIPVSSRANVAVGEPFFQTYSLIPSEAVITDTVVLGELDPGQRYLQVIVNQGEVFFDDDVAPSSFRASTQGFSPDLPFVITPTVVADTIGAHQQILTIPGLTPRSIVISDSVVAQDPPLTFDVFRTYPGAVQQGAVYTAAWRVGSAGVVISDTILAGRLFGGIYEGVIGDGAICDLGISSFTCSVPVLDPQGPQAIITFSTRALTSGRNDHVLEIGDADPLTVTTTTTVVPPPLIEVIIDIKPGGFPNPINPRSHGNIPVAILSTRSLDVVSQIDQSSLAFGPTGAEDSLLFCRPEEVNGDRRLDLVCHFDTQLAGFQYGDTQGILTGMTLGGIPIQGSDAVVIVPPRPPRR